MSSNHRDPAKILDSLAASNIFDLRGVVAVVTGGGSGIGLMISTTLMANGATVYMIGPDQPQLGSVMDRIADVYNKASEGVVGRGKLVGLEGDVRLKEEAIRLADEIGKREPNGVTVLFNNAGVLEAPLPATPLKPAPNSSVDPSSPTPPTLANFQAFADRYLGVHQAQFDNTFRVNAVGAYWMAAAFLPLFGVWSKSWEERGNEAAKRFAPQVVMTSSMNGWTKDPTTAASSFPYLFSKAAIGMFTSQLARELLPLGVRVNGIAPGWFITDMTSPNTYDTSGASAFPPTLPAFEIPTRQHPEASSTGAIANSARLGGTNRDMGSLALMLVANWYVTGETVLIDGGTLLLHPSSY